MSLDRDLRFYELICAGMNVSFMADVDVPGLNRQNLNDALNCVKLKHPYLRMKFAKSDAGVLRFEEADREFVPIEEHQAKDLDEFNDWKEKLIDAARVKRDFEKSLVFLALVSLAGNASKHRIYGCINHSGIDGPGMVTVVKDLLHFLDKTVAGEEVSVESRPFLDIHMQYDTERFDLETLRKEPVITENYLPGFKPIPDEIDCDPHVSAEFYQFDEATSKKLVENCRHHKATVQGAVSIASLIGLLDTHKQDISSPVKSINVVPCNMRGLLEPKLTNEDLVCGSAALTWPQDVQSDDNIWTLVTDATASLHKLRESMQGYKWWIKLANSLPFQQYSIMSSSVGLVELNEKELKRVTINDVRMLGGSYNVPKSGANNMTHVITALGRLTVVMSYSHPGLGKKWAKQYAKVQSHVLKYLADFNVNQDKPKTLGEILAEV